MGSILFKTRETNSFYMNMKKNNKNPHKVISTDQTWIKLLFCIQIPKGCSDLHHEVELGVVISQNGTNIEQNQAMDHVGGYVLALDMTARDFQRDASKKGQPWLLAKGFDTSCPISDFIPKEKLPDPDNVRLWLKTDGAMKQDGNTKDMIFRIPYLISYISNIVTLEEGDLILTGTPAGVSTVNAGQQITAGMNELVEMSFSVTN